MTARACAKELGNIVDPLRTIALPPRPAHSREEAAFLTGWRRWIAWEKSDPCVLEDIDAIKMRVKYAYKQCLMLCRFFPEMWFDAATYYESIGEGTEAGEVLRQGLLANPKSWLLGFAFAEFEESAKRAENVKNTFENLLSSNEAEIALAKSEMECAVPVALGTNAMIAAGEATPEKEDEDDTEIQLGRVTNEPTERFELERAAKIQRLAEEGSVAWVMYMRAMRRLEGIKGARQIFARARKVTHQTYQIYIASGNMVGVRIETNR